MGGTPPDCPGGDTGAGRRRQVGPANDSSLVTGTRGGLVRGPGRGRPIAVRGLEPGVAARWPVEEPNRKRYRAACAIGSDTTRTHVRG